MIVLVLFGLSACGKTAIRTQCGTNDMGVGGPYRNNWKLLAPNKRDGAQVLCQFEYFPHLPDLMTPHAIWISRPASGRAVAWVQAIGRNGDIETFHRDLWPEAAESIRELCGRVIEEAKVCPPVGMQYFMLGQPGARGELHSAVGTERAKLSGWDAQGNAVMIFDVMRWVHNYVTEPEVLLRFNADGLEQALRRTKKVLNAPSAKVPASAASGGRP